jgi:short-subunit dehydrogenase
MAATKRTVLITGCSDGSLGAALAIAFHNAGLHVYATARDPSKLKQVQSLGIETLTLDVLLDSSIVSCVKSLSSLDILVNNAGAQFLMPVVDISIVEAKKLFDLNVWSHISMTQACLPLLLKSSSAMIVNQTSVAAVTTLPFQSVYSASKAAMAMFSDTLRLELEPFNIKVVDLRTAAVKSNIIQSFQASKVVSLPASSIYQPAKEKVEVSLRQEKFENMGMASDQWAALVVGDLLRKSPPPVIWRGESAALARFATVMPFGTFDGTVKKITGMDAVEQMLRK